MKALGPLLLLFAIAAPPAGARAAPTGPGPRTQDPEPGTAAKHKHKKKGKQGAKNDAGSAPNRPTFRKPNPPPPGEARDTKSDEPPTSRIRMRPRRDPSLPPPTPEELAARQATRAPKPVGPPRGVLRPPPPPKDDAGAAPATSAARPAEPSAAKNDAPVELVPDAAAPTPPKASEKARARTPRPAAELTRRALGTEIRTHWSRLARLDELGRLFLARGDMPRYRRVDELRGLENRRYRDALTDFRGALGNELQRVLDGLRGRGGRWSRPDSVVGEELLRGEE